MEGIFTAILRGDGLFECIWVRVQSPENHLFGGGRCLGGQAADMRQVALTIDKHLEARGSVPRHEHIGFPVPAISSLGCRQRALHQAGSVLYPLASLPIRALGCPLSMVTGQIANEVIRLTKNILVNRFVTDRGPLALMF